MRSMGRGMYSPGWWLFRSQYLQLKNQTHDVGGLLHERRQKLMDRARLSPRERAVLEMLLQGATHAEIARELGISVRTSKFHQGNVLAKLGADSRADLLRIFV